MGTGFGWDYGDNHAWMRRAPIQDPLIITCALNGGIQGKESHPALPEHPEEIAAQAYAAYNAGASIVHIHGRDPSSWGDCTNDPAVYREINALVRERCPDIIINNTTGGGPTTTDEARIACLDAMPEMASINMGPDMSRFQIAERPPTMDCPRPAMEVDICLPFTYGFIEKLAGAMQERGIRPEMEIYQPGQYWVSQDLIDKGLVATPYVFQFVMGSQTGIYPTPRNLLHMVSELPRDAVFSVIGIGKFQWSMAAMGVLLGGNVRVGLEDNLYLMRGQKLTDNAEAVAKVVRLASELNRPVATPTQAREIYGLSPVPSSY